MLSLHCKIKVSKRRFAMRLTHQELKDIVSSTLIRYLANEEGVALDTDKVCSLVKWVDSHDFEEILEDMREEW